MDCLANLAITKEAGPLWIGCAVTAQRISAFLCAYVKSSVIYAAANLFFIHIGKHL